MSVLFAVISAGLLQLQHRRLRAQEQRIVAALVERYDLPTPREGQAEPVRERLARTWRGVMNGTTVGLMFAAVLAALGANEAIGAVVALALLAWAGGQVGRGWGARLRGATTERAQQNDFVPPWFQSLELLGGGLVVASAVGGWLLADRWWERLQIGVLVVGVSVATGMLIRARRQSLTHTVDGVPEGLASAVRAEAVRAQSVGLASMTALAAVVLVLTGMGGQHPNVVPAWLWGVAVAGLVVAVGAMLAGVGAVSWYLEHAGHPYRRSTD